jgi:hypothetical protein
MVYVGAGGQVQSERSSFRLSIFSDIFWAIMNIIGLFFNTIFGDPRAKIGKKSSNTYTRYQAPRNGPTKGNIKGEF